MPESETNSPALPPDVPPEAAEFLREVGYLQPDRLKVGDAAPRLTLRLLNGEGVAGAAVEIGAPNVLRPVALIFGSYT